jgi:hypothetical protein
MLPRAPSSVGYKTKKTFYGFSPFLLMADRVVLVVLNRSAPQAELLEEGIGVEKFRL